MCSKICLKYVINCLCSAQNASTICSICDQNNVKICQRSLENLFKVWSMSVQKLFNICWWSVQNLLKICPNSARNLSNSVESQFKIKYVQNQLKISLSTVNMCSKICPNYVIKLSMFCSKCVYHMFKTWSK